MAADGIWGVGFSFHKGEQTGRDMQYRHLLAKKSRSPDAPDPIETLPGHTLQVIRVAKLLVEAWGETFLRSMGLPPSWGNRLHEAVTRGAFLHDLGKANHQFQRLLRQGPATLQALRHEWLSLWVLLRFPALNAWLFPDGNTLTRQAALIAAIGHHLEVESGSALVPRDGSGDSRIAVMLSHADVTTLLEQTSREITLAESFPRLQDVHVDLLADNPLSEVQSWIADAFKWWQQVSPDERRFVALAKAIVIVADLAGSALPRSGVNAVNWVEQVLSRTCGRSDLERLATRKLNGRPLRPFQSAVAGSPARITLVRAGCGSGKTTAAYLWASRHAQGRKLFVCYPTTGTATEGYVDYVLSDEMEATLIHSRSDVDLDDLQAAPDCDPDFRIRLESLASWDVPLIVCTADTVLGLVQNNRRGLFAFPAIANGAFVFDEVHAYDDRMFGSLLRFIEAFRGVPVLLMTASLPRERIKRLKELAAKLDDRLEDIPGPEDLEAIPRYRVQCGILDDGWAEVRRELARGGKILWVTNTVERAVALGQQASRQGLKPVYVYHSRYRYCDRIQRHRAVVEAFRKPAGPVLAITTQVCEVSLDLSADLLVTDLAPVPSLIQRLGRLNRYATPGTSTEPKTAIVLEPDNSLLEPDNTLPYDRQEIAEARKWLGRVSERPVSQADLAQAFMRVASDRNGQAVEPSAWLDGGPFSTTAPLREPGATIPVIRYEDKEAAQADRKQVIRLSIPMLLGPVAMEVEAWPRLGVARLAPRGRIEYSEEWGAAWRK